jgi:GNAT superfamily N-acetyltransferase
MVKGSCPNRPTWFDAGMSFDLRPFAPQDADWLVARHAALYARDDGFDESFGPLVAGIIADFLGQPEHARQAGWIAWVGDERLGSIFCVGEDPATPQIAKLRLFLVEPQARGTGLAQTLLDTCLGFARRNGYAQMRLWTHESHRAAGRIYTRNGFTLISARPVHSFGQDLVEQIWQRDL